ncbi:MAG: hypothetical protein J5716_03035 [Alphaproteobacteria bacterium]|nr:hypothetical protein [Alphaproteobacteria bacterium]
MKKSLPALLISLFAFNANAQTAPLYRFTDELKNAAKDCSPYEEDFSATNPILKTVTKFFGLDDISTFIRVKGKNEKGFCDFSIVSQMDDIVVSDQVCSVSPEQLTNIYDAMTDQSTERITETFTTYITYSKPDGTKEKKPMQTTVTDTKMNIAWQKISGTACEKREIKFSDQDMKRLQRKTFALPKDFIESLQICRPAKAEKNITFFSMTAEITGVKSGLCQIKMPPFELSLNKKHVQKIETWIDFYSFAEDPATAKYIPEYSTMGLSGTMKACAYGDKQYNAGSESSSFGDVKIAKGLSSSFSDDVCTITFKNTMEIKGKTTDYSKICKLSKEDVIKMFPTDPNKEKEENGFSFSLPFSEEERKLSEDLYDKLTQQNFCN